MAQTGYEPVNWSEGEPAYTKKLQRMVANDHWLFKNTPRMRYTAHDLVRTEGLKIAAGIKPIVATQQDHYIEPVEFGTFFSSACYPVVVVGGLINRNTIRAHVGARAFSGQQIDHRGFEVIVSADQRDGANYLPTNFYVPWIAMGF